MNTTAIFLPCNSPVNRPDHSRSQVRASSLPHPAGKLFFIKKQSNSNKKEKTLNIVKVRVFYGGTGECVSANREASGACRESPAAATSYLLGFIRDVFDGRQLKSAHNRGLGLTYHLMMDVWAVQDQNDGFSFRWTFLPWVHWGPALLRYEFPGVRGIPRGFRRLL